MNKMLKVSNPKYFLIAADIAAKIVNKDYKEGEKVYARSAIASQYGVSSETARRAICVLSDLGIVNSMHGSGVIIKSYDAAVRFIRQNQSVKTLTDLKQELVESVERQNREMKIFSDCLNKLIIKTERFRAFNPFTPFQIDITSDTPYIGKTISDVNFWHSTSATIVAIRRDDEILISPGPYAELCEGDTLFFIGDESCNERVSSFLYP